MGRHRWMKKERNRKAAEDARDAPRLAAERQAWVEDMIAWMEVMVGEIQAGKLPDNDESRLAFAKLVGKTLKAQGHKTRVDAARAVVAAGHDYARTFAILDLDIPAVLAENDLKDMMNTPICNTTESSGCGLDFGTPAANHTELVSIIHGFWDDLRARPPHPLSFSELMKKKL